ncbi:VOC family protein (plasmid) [Deinococcus sp. KNUC1210]|uniref:VOC family protein n=1 Tax=Deinococcus sp. KNUC1210 TaxID=2917691 RepID=UPI001EF088C8|nr:VOC family protein [Deinococcus sp. KNUC1210]ULH14062.1 VOC family protein [Deinococcus sp. KNUC1210]
MKPQLTVVTLAVEDLDRSLKFYRDGLRFTTQGIVGTEFEHGAVVFFELEGSLRLALWPAASLSAEGGINATRQRLGAVSLGHNVASRAEVDTVMAQVAEAGAVITAAPCERFFGGYSGYFHDPDGHLWEVVWNPKWNGEL